MNTTKTGIQFIEAVDFEELSRISADLMIELVKQKPDALICLASGGSPARAYELFVERVLEQQMNVTGLRILKLDEWWGVPGTDPSTCEYYMQTRIVRPLNITPQNYISFDSSATDAEAECKRIARILKEQGPIDLCILGMGKNGHLGLNEPGPHSIPFTHVAELDVKTKTHDMLTKTGADIKYGMTIGMADIMASDTILFLAAGEEKNEAYSEFLKAQVHSWLPASVLWLHPKTLCIFEKRIIS